MSFSGLPGLRQHRQTKIGRSHWLLAYTFAAGLMLTGALAGSTAAAAPPADKVANKTAPQTAPPAAPQATPQSASKPASKTAPGSAPTNAPDRPAVRVVVTGLRNNKGVVYCKLHERRASFPSGKHASIRHTKARPAGREATCTFTGVAPGRYAVVIAHDENGNGRIDSNLIGIPKEGYGFSNNVAPLFSAPGFDSAGFKVMRATTVTIRVIYR